MPAGQTFQISRSLSSKVNRRTTRLQISPRWVAVFQNRQWTTPNLLAHSNNNRHPSTTWLEVLGEQLFKRDQRRIPARLLEVGILTRICRYIITLRYLFSLFPDERKCLQAATSSRSTTCTASKQRPSSFNNQKRRRFRRPALRLRQHWPKIGGKEPKNGRHEGKKFIFTRRNSNAASAQRETENKYRDPIDVKVETWAKGKEANVRALIASLQEVLWEGNSWKPISVGEILQVKIYSIFNRAYF